MDPSTEFQCGPQDLKGQLFHLLSYLYNPAHWRAAAVSRQTQCHSYFQFPSWKHFPSPATSGLDVVYEITKMRGLLFFSEINPTRDFYPISRLYCYRSGWKGSISISKCEWSQSKRVTVPSSQPCLYQGPATSFPGFQPKCWVPFIAVNPQLCQHWLSDQSHKHTAQLCNVTQMAVTMLCYRDITASSSSRRLQLITLLHHAAVTTAGPAV